MKLIDLHVHSNYSDGDYSPEELVKMAKKAGLSAIAICDHDGVCAIPEAMNLCKKINIELISGIEMSTHHKNQEYHILGYFIDYHDKRLINFSNEARKAKFDRVKKMVKKLNRLGFVVTLKDVLQEMGVGRSTMGRPHIAFAVLKNKENLKKLADNKIDPYIFMKDYYLSAGKPAYVLPKAISTQKAINLIHSCGGIASLAHAYSKDFNNKRPINYKLIKEFKVMGLDAVEAYYSDHSKKETKFLIDSAEKLNLLITGGTDFHGRAKPGVKIGRGYGNLKIHYKLVEKMKEKYEK